MPLGCFSLSCLEYIVEFSTSKSATDTEGRYNMGKKENLVSILKRQKKRL